MQPGPPQRLVGVDVADAGDQRLVEQRPLDARCAWRRSRRTKAVVVERRVERVAARCARSRPAARRRPVETSRPPNIRWSTKRSSRRAVVRRRTGSGPAGGARRGRRSAGRGAGRSCPRWPSRASPSSSGSQRYLPRRRARLTGGPVSAVGEVGGAGEVAADRARVQHLDVGDGAADDVAGEAAPDDLDLGQLGHGGRGSARRRGRGSATVVGAARAAARGSSRVQASLGGLLLGFLLAPARRRGRSGRVADADLGGEGLRVVGAVVLDDVLGHAERVLRRRAPAGWSSSPGRRRARRRRPSAGRRAGARPARRPRSRR